MEILRIEILNPKAIKLIQSLAELDLIKINKETAKPEILSHINKIRANSENELSLEEIKEEVDIVRSIRY